MLLRDVIAPSSYDEATALGISLDTTQVTQYLLDFVNYPEGGTAALTHLARLVKPRKPAKNPTKAPSWADEPLTSEAFIS